MEGVPSAALKEPRKVTMPGGRYSAPTRQDAQPAHIVGFRLRGPATLRSSLSAAGSNISAKAALNSRLPA